MVGLVDRAVASATLPPRIRSALFAHRATVRMSLQFSRAILTTAIIFAASTCGGGRGARFLDVATTTSVANSGLSDVLLPAFQKETGITVRLMVAGSGRALQILARGDAPAAISHAPDLEASTLPEHPGWTYRKFMYNDFVIVGPDVDPAGVRHAPTAAEAFRRIAVSEAEFVSRGDSSGTHEKEQALWRGAGVRPIPERLTTSGQGMAGTLRVASARTAYTISDRATFAQLGPVVRLSLLFEGDPLLLNTYAVIVADPTASPDASAFAGWLTTGDGRNVIRAFRVRGDIAAFTPWPEGKANSAPGDRP